MAARTTSSADRTAGRSTAPQSAVASSGRKKLRGYGFGGSTTCAITFGSLAIRRFDLVAVKEMMGHSKLTTTERYLHSRPRPTDAATLTAIFSGEEEQRAA